MIHIHRVIYIILSTKVQNNEKGRNLEGKVTVMCVKCKDRIYFRLNTETLFLTNQWRYGKIHCRADSKLATKTPSRKVPPPGQQQQPLSVYA